MISDKHIVYQYFLFSTKIRISDRLKEVTIDYDNQQPIQQDQQTNNKTQLQKWSSLHNQNKHQNQINSQSIEEKKKYKILLNNLHPQEISIINDYFTVHVINRQINYSKLILTCKDAPYQLEISSETPYCMTCTSQETFKFYNQWYQLTMINGKEIDQKDDEIISALRNTKIPFTLLFNPIKQGFLQNSFILYFTENFTVQFTDRQINDGKIILHSEGVITNSTTTPSLNPGPHDIQISTRKPYGITCTSKDALECYNKYNKLTLVNDYSIEGQIQQDMILLLKYTKIPFALTFSPLSHSPGIKNNYFTILFPNFDDFTLHFSSRQIDNDKITLTTDGTISNLTTQTSESIHPGPHQLQISTKYPYDIVCTSPDALKCYTKYNKLTMIKDYKGDYYKIDHEEEKMSKKV